MLDCGTLPRGTEWGLVVVLIYVKARIAIIRAQSTTDMISGIQHVFILGLGTSMRDPYDNVLCRASKNSDLGWLHGFWARARF